MPTVTAKYLGDLRVECRHEASGATLVTDAPVDNHGKGQSFSPTDLCSTSLGACALTIIGIQCQDRGLDISGATLEITKIMASDPRRIGKIQVVFHLPPRAWAESEKAFFEDVARNCPVCKSLSPDLEQEMIFDWQ